MQVEQTREEIVEWLSRYFTAYYDVNRVSEAGEPLKLRCDLHVNNQKYVLFKENVMWEANCHEYIYVFSVPELTEEMYRLCEKLAYDAGMLLVDPAPNHMYTYITCLIVADRTEPAAVRALKKCRIRKSFRFSLRGWMEFHTAVLDRSSGRVFTNRGGREYAKLFHNYTKVNKKKVKES